METKRIVIFSGGTLGRWALSELQAGDILVGADRGAHFLVQNGLRPHFSLGDFDSVTSEELEAIRAESMQFLDCDPVNKDLTDTEMAFDWALKQHPAEIVLVGALGSRFDHSLANVHLLRLGLQKKISCKIVDERNEVHLIDRSIMLCKGRYSHVSLLPLSMRVTGIELQGFRYPLFNATLELGQSRGISNVLEQNRGQIFIREGLLLVIQSTD